MMEKNIRQLQSELIEWWKVNGREFPWRKTRDPYKILIAEVLLHRTRAEQVVPIYLKLIREFPDIFSLAKADKNVILNYLYSLGLRWRAELLHKMAQEIVKRGGEIEANKEWLLSLPGISHYIASAVLCFAFGRPEPLLDTNTVRILGRIFNIKVTDSSRRSKKFRELYFRIMDKNHPREFNFAMIDLGALVCRPENPMCKNCPLKNLCLYYQITVGGGDDA